MERKFIPQMEPSFDEAEANAVYEYMKSGGWVMEFKKTAELEQMIAEFTGAAHCIMTNNGTVSLTLALLAVGLKAGDEVLVPDLTMIATPNSAKLIGVDPVLVDVEKQTLCMDLARAEKALTQKTKAVMYVPFNGRSGNMAEVVRFCKENNLYLIEDAAQALGSYWNGRHLGTFGDIGSFSFSVPKVITTGQGGALITDNDKLAKKIRKLKDFGREKGGNDVHNEFGWNFKFTDLQAVVGIEQMKKLKARLKRKKEIYARYMENLKNMEEIEFIPTNLENTSPWFVEILVENPDGLSGFLNGKCIGTRRIYPAVHSQAIYADQLTAGLFQKTDYVAARGLWLPSASSLADNDIDYITGSIREYYGAKL